MQIPNRVPRHLRPRREKIFGPAPSRQLDGNAKARVWAAAAAYNAQNRQQRQHQGPLTWATLRVLRALLWRFHGADGGGRCFPSYEKIAAAARCARSSVAVAIKALEDAGLLTWVNRIARIRRRVRDLLGHMSTEWQVIRISNGYTFGDPLDREPGRKAYKSDYPTRPQNRDFKNQPKGGAHLVGAQVIRGEPPFSPPQTIAPPLALQREHGIGAGVRLTPSERAALVAKMDRGEASPADRALYGQHLEALITKGGAL
jgi:hypothetical protein